VPWGVRVGKAMAERVRMARMNVRIVVSFLIFFHFPFWYFLVAPLIGALPLVYEWTVKQMSSRVERQNFEVAES
jgi:hypothetical protein